MVPVDGTAADGAVGSALRTTSTVSIAFQTLFPYDFRTDGTGRSRALELSSSRALRLDLVIFFKKVKNFLSPAGELESSRTVRTYGYTVSTAAVG